MVAFVDINNDFLLNPKPLLIKLDDAVKNTILNLFRTPKGSQRFNPLYGTNLHYFLQEQLTETTTYKMEASIMQDIERWLPRIKVLRDNFSIEVDYSLPGYIVNLTYVSVGSGNTNDFQIAIKV